MTELALLLGLALAAGPSPNDAAARAAALEGRAAFEKGDYAAALAKYTRAYELKPVAGLLFNLGQCHRQLGNHEKAISFLQRYLDSGPPSEAQAQATKELIADERGKLAKAEAANAADAEQKRQLELEAARAAAARAEADAAAKKAEAAAKSAEQLQKQHELEALIKEAPPPPPPPQPAFYERWWFWGGVAVVVAAGVTTGVVLGTQAHPTPTTFPDINAR